MKKYLIALMFVSTSSFAVDHTVMPKGVVAVTDKSVLCVPGYSSTVRPPVSYTNRLKRIWVGKGHNINEYELDHYIPIALGGSPTDPNNLWLQYWASAKRKDVQEALLHRDMCKGIYTPQQAQELMRRWR